MCCFWLSLVLLGPRIVGAFWWIFQPLRWQTTFAGWAGIWWIWPVLGILFLPWTTLMYVLVAPGGVVGWEWLGLVFIGDIVSYGGGAGRKQIPGYQGYLGLFSRVPVPAKDAGLYASAAGQAVDVRAGSLHKHCQPSARGLR